MSSSFNNFSAQQSYPIANQQSGQYNPSLAQQQQQPPGIGFIPPQPIYSTNATPPQQYQPIYSTTQPASQYAHAQPASQPAYYGGYPQPTYPPYPPYPPHQPAGAILINPPPPVVTYPSHTSFTPYSVSTNTGLAMGVGALAGFMASESLHDRHHVGAFNNHHHHGGGGESKLNIGGRHFHRHHFGHRF